MSFQQSKQVRTHNMSTSCLAVILPSDARTEERDYSPYSPPYDPNNPSYSPCSPSNFSEFGDTCKEHLYPTCNDRVRIKPDWFKPKIEHSTRKGRATSKGRTARKNLKI